MDILTPSLGDIDCFGEHVFKEQGQKKQRNTRPEECVISISYQDHKVKLRLLVLLHDDGAGTDRP